MCDYYLFRKLFRALVCAALVCGSVPSWAGAQREEDLADAVKAALQRVIADPRPPKLEWRSAEQKQAFEQWHSVMSERLRRKVPDNTTRSDILNTVWYESKRAGLDPAMVLGLMQVESNFRKYAMSHVGARGYMQVMPFWTRAIGDGDPNKLFHMQANLRYGCTILRYYLDKEKGNLFLTLGRYNGSRGRPEYPNLILAAWEKWKYNGSELMSAPALAAHSNTPAPPTVGVSPSPAIVPAPAPAPPPPAKGAQLPASNPFSRQRI